MATSSGSDEAITVINKQQLSQIIGEAEAGVDDYVIFDVRSPEEIASTGSLSSAALNLPVDVIAVSNVIFICNYKIHITDI